MAAQSSSLSPQERGGTIAYIAAMLMLGTLGVFVEEARLDSVTIVFFRCAFGALALALYCGWKGFFARVNFQARNVWLAVLSGLMMVGQWVAFFESILRVGISVATIVFHVQPFLVLLLGALVLREKISLDKFFWICVGFCGLVLAAGLHFGGMAMSGGYVIGIACTLLGAFLYAGVMLTTKAMRGMLPHLTALIHCLVGTLILSFWVSLPGLHLGAAQWGWLAGLGTIHTALVYVLVYGALPKVRTASIAVLTFIYPAAAVGFDFLVYGHALNLWQAGGLVLIVLAGLGVNLNWHWRRLFAARVS